MHAIISQQLSTKAAATIEGASPRSSTAVRRRPRCAVSDEQLRAVGLSAQKLRYMRDLCARISTGHVQALALRADEDVIEALTR